MASERPDHDERIADAIRALAGEPKPLDAPPPELWSRISGALDAADDATAEPVPPPADLWDRIALEVRADAEGPTDGPADELTDRSPRSRPAATPVRRRRTALVAAAAAVLLVLVGAAVLVVDRDRGTDRTELVARAELSGDGLVPGGDGTGSARLVRTDGDWEVEIQVAELPDPAPGTYYEAWLLGPGTDQVQSLGTLEGTGGFAVPRGLDLDDFPQVDVSVEPLDGDPAHSTKSVLRGQLTST